LIQVKVIAPGAWKIFWFVADSSCRTWESPMRSLLLLISGIAVGAAAFGGSANAQNYPWCAIYGGADTGGASNCGFTTFEQCMATRSGMGGFCEPNTQYVPPGSHPAPVHRPRHGRHY
jgi:hypothetical protein